LKRLKDNEKKQHSVRVHKHLSDCIVISPMDKSLLDLSPKKEEVIVDIATGQSALRGSHIFAPGIMAMTSGKINQPYYTLFRIRTEFGVHQFSLGGGQALPVCHPQQSTFCVV